MSEKKVLLNNLISCTKNIKRKVLDMRRGVIDSDNYFRETFKPIIDPLNTIIEKKNSENASFPQNINNDIEEDSEFAFEHFLKSSPQSRKYDKTFGLNYDEVENTLKIGNVPVTIKGNNLCILDKIFPWTYGLWSLLCEQIPSKTTPDDIEAYYTILKSTNVHLKNDYKPRANANYKWMKIVKPLYKRMNDDPVYSDKIKAKKDLVKVKRKYPTLKIEPVNKYSKHGDNDSPLSNKSFDFSPSPHSNTDNTENLIGLDMLVKENQKGSSLYKDVIPNTQLVYYDNPNELVTRLNLLVSSQNAGNTGVNNEIISILEELRERKLII